MNRNTGEVKKFKEYLPGYLHQIQPDDKKPRNNIHPFVKLCEERGIEHRYHIGQAPLDEWHVKEHTGKKYHYEDIDQFKKHLYY
jgi:hypothetical protein